MLLLPEVLNPHSLPLHTLPIPLLKVWSNKVRSPNHLLQLHGPLARSQQTRPWRVRPQPTPPNPALTPLSPNHPQIPRLLQKGLKDLHISPVPVSPLETPSPPPLPGPPAVVERARGDRRRLQRIRHLQTCGTLGRVPDDEAGGRAAAFAGDDEGSWWGAVALGGGYLPRDVADAG